MLSILSLNNPLFSSKYDILLEEEEDAVIIPNGLPPVPWPETNPYTKQKAELGRLLYFDRRLSTDGTISCASCHSVPSAFTDHKSVSIGIKGQKGTRHSPTVINAAYHKLLFWDGRANSLEEQCKGPISNPKEMTLDKDVHIAYADCHKRVKEVKGYCELFKEIFGTEDCTIEQISQAIATF